MKDVIAKFNYNKDTYYVGIINGELTVMVWDPGEPFNDIRGSWSRLESGALYEAVIAWYSNDIDMPPGRYLRKMFGNANGHL